LSIVDQEGILDYNDESLPQIELVANSGATFGQQTC